jgi:hypothetical protein
MNESTEYTRTSRLAGASFRLGVLALSMLLIIGCRIGYLILGRAGSVDEPSFRSPTQEEVVLWNVIEVICQVVAVVAALAALALGIAALVEIRRGAGKVEWRGRAASGMVMASLTLLTLVVVYGLVMPILGWRARKIESSNNLKVLGLAMHIHHDFYGHFPPACSMSKDGKPLLSWRVHILPFIGQDNLYRQFHLDEPWDSPANKPLLAYMPRVFEVPGSARAAEGFTHYQVLVGPGTAFERPDLRSRLGSLPRGADQTILVVEAADPVPWTKPEDLAYAPDGPLPKLGGVVGNGFHAMFADASVRWIEADEQDNALRTLVPLKGR